MIKHRSLAVVILLSMLIAGCTTENSNNGNNAGRANSNTGANSNQTASTSNANNSNNSITIPLPNLDQIKEDAKKAGSKIGDKAEDAMIWAQLRTSFTTDSELRDVKVDVEDGAVTLTGTVASNAAKTKAEEKARGVSGVKSVVNNIKVSNA